MIVKLLCVCIVLMICFSLFGLSDVLVGFDGDVSSMLCVWLF